MCGVSLVRGYSYPLFVRIVLRNFSQGFLKKDKGLGEESSGTLSHFSARGLSEEFTR